MAGSRRKRPASSVTLPKHRRRLPAVQAEAEGIRVPDEILADFTGDALADPRFLQTLATRNPSKSPHFTETVVSCTVQRIVTA
jgi:hypothetical protein